MARTGGRTPWDQSNAATGPARVVWAPTSVAVPTAPVDVVQQVADPTTGEYPVKTGWVDFGLAADAPSYSTSRETGGLEYQQPSQELFRIITSIERQFTAQVAEIDVENLKIIENSSVATAAVAASAAAAAIGVKSAAFTKVFTGNYTDLTQVRIAMVSYRPVGAGVVTEPGPPVVTRPPAIWRFIPLCVLSADSQELEFSEGDPTNAAVTFDVLPDPSAGAGKEHGWWAIEMPGAIAA